MNFESFFASVVVYAPRGLKIASRLLQDGLFELIWTQHGPKLAPSLGQVGPMLAPSWFQLGSSWVHVGPSSGSPAAPGPTQAFPDSKPLQTLLKRLRPIRRAWAAGFGDWEDGCWTSQTPNLPPKSIFPGSQS